MQPSLMVDSNDPDWAKLRNSLQSGHELILDQLEQCRRDRKSPSGLQPYRILEDTVMIHLGCQSADLYRSLGHHLQQEGSHSKILEYLDFDLKDLKIKLLTFMETPASKFLEFRNDLTARVTIEREYLIPLIELQLTHVTRKIKIYEN